MNMHATYVSAPVSAWIYEKPLRMGAKTLLLTIGGICLTGNWYGALGENFVAWAPLPQRDKAAEARILAAR